MFKVTIDTNVFIKAFKSNELGHELVQRLIHFHKMGQISIQVVAANAAENGRAMIGEERSLKSELSKLGLDNAHIIPIPLILGVSHLGHSYLVGEETVDLLKQIWSILFGETPFEHEAFCDSFNIEIRGDDYIDKRWRNYVCDALTILEYIQDCQKNTDPNNFSIFTTMDNDDILKNADQLEKLGAINILDLSQTVQTIEDAIRKN